jgi:hypothetical protein
LGKAWQGLLWKLQRKRKITAPHKNKKSTPPGFKILQNLREISLSFLGGCVACFSHVAPRLLPGQAWTGCRRKCQRKGEKQKKRAKSRLRIKIRRVGFPDLRSSGIFEKSHVPFWGMRRVFLPCCSQVASRSGFGKGPAGLPWKMPKKGGKTKKKRAQARQPTMRTQGEAKEAGVGFLKTHAYGAWVMCADPFVSEGKAFSPPGPRASSGEV